MLDAEESRSYEPFLQSKEGEQEIDIPDELWRNHTKPGGPAWTLQTNIFIHFILIIFYTAVTVILLWMNSPQTIYSNGKLEFPTSVPAQPPSQAELTVATGRFFKAGIQNLTIAYKQKLFVNLTDNPFAGQPSLDIDDAWDSLLGNMNIRVTAEELQRNGQHSVSLPEGGGYLAWLGVFHELHCINMVRKWVYRDYYHQNMSAHEFAHWSSHADHCIDLLRQTALCHVDASLTTFVWNATVAKPMFDAGPSSRRCVDFERVVAEMGGRVVSLGEMGRLGGDGDGEWGIRGRGEGVRGKGERGRL